MLRAIFHPVGREFTPLESFPHIEGEREKRGKKSLNGDNSSRCCSHAPSHQEKDTTMISITLRKGIFDH
jgi:hypothetical protein